LGVLKISACTCVPIRMARIERSWWMRFLWWKRLYFCDDCGSRQLISRRY